MAKKLLFGLALALLAACGNRQPSAGTSELRQVAAFRLGDGAELRLASDGDLSQVELYYGGALQELVGTANTTFCTDSAGRIALDTVHLDGGLAPQYIVRTYDRSSTYGAEVWYIVHPYRRDAPDGPWSLLRVPGDRPTLSAAASLIIYP